SPALKAAARSVPELEGLLPRREVRAEEEREFEGLLRVQSWIAEGAVAIGELILGDAAGAADALADGLAGDLDVESAEHRAELRVHSAMGLNLPQDRIKVPGFPAVWQDLG